VQCSQFLLPPSSSFPRNRRPCLALQLR